MKKLLILSAVLYLSACSGDADKSTEGEDLATIAATQSPTLGQVAEAVADASAIPQMIQGSWVSVEDPKATLVITQDKYILGYEGTKDDTVDYTISHKSCTDSTESKEDYYLFIPKDDMCYIIVDANEKNLSFIYTARGNTLTYTRAK